MTAGKLKARRERLRADGRCVDCARRKARPGRARCARCARKASRSTQDWQRRNRARVRADARHRMESLYWSNPDVFRGSIAARRLAKKLNGICYDCPEPSLEDNVRCKRCRDRCNKTQRKWSRAKYRKSKRNEQLELRAYRPIDDVIDLTRVRILRAARPLDWFTFGELFDLLGGGDERQRNTMTKMLERLTTAKLFERRPAAHGFSAGYGARWEYLISAGGVAELERVLRPVRSPGMRAA